MRFAIFGFDGLNPKVSITLRTQLVISPFFLKKEVAMVQTRVLRQLTHLDIVLKVYFI